MNPSRAKAIKETLAQLNVSEADVKACVQEWAIVHDTYNTACTENPSRGRRSGTDFENLRRHAVGAYEALLDALRIHSDNHAHLAALKGRL